MAGKRQPLNMLLINGNKHLTKEEVRTRQENEVDAPADNVTVPNYLTKKLKEDFTEIADELLRINLMSNLDADALARFLFAREQYIRITKALRSVTPVTTVTNEITKKKHIISNDVYSDLLISQDKLFKQCRQSAADLGLTISSRCRLVIPKKPVEEKPASKFSRFGGGG